MTVAPVPWAAIFGNTRAVEVEIGPGRGDVLLAFARARPERNFFGIEHRLAAAEALSARAQRQGLTNVRTIGADARCIVPQFVPPGSVAAYHLYFPDPWPKNRHRGRRVVDGAFAAALATTLAPDGQVHVATDLPDLFAAICRTLSAAGLVAAPAATSPVRPLSRFERKYASAGAYGASFVQHS